MVNQKIKKLYQYLWIHFIIQKDYKIRLDDLESNGKISKELILKHLVTPKYLELGEKLYDCPHCGDTLSHEDNQYMCMMCDWSISEIEIKNECIPYQNLFKGENFNQLEQLMK